MDKTIENFVKNSTKAFDTLNENYSREFFYGNINVQIYVDMEKFLNLVEKRKKNPGDNFKVYSWDLLTIYFFVPKISTGATTNLNLEPACLPADISLRIETLHISETMEKEFAKNPEVIADLAKCLFEIKRNLPSDYWVCSVNEDFTDDENLLATYERIKNNNRNNNRR